MKTLQTAKLAYLTNPEPGRYYLNFQFYEGVEVTQVEISKAQLSNIVGDGFSMALRENAANGDVETNAAFVGGS